MVATLESTEPAGRIGRGGVEVERPWDDVPDVEVNVDIRAGRAVMVVTGEVDHDGVGVLRRAVADAVAAGATRLVVDLSGMEFGDSSLVNTLMAAWRAVVPGGGRVALVGVRPEIDTVLATTGVRGRLPQYATVEEAVRDA
ncbi:STAS domain-containing protein [Streptomyces sp. TRM70308]|uniref:STAS domain-containing protein n=1 Tax=Streptomyces sp. TRM70308 TaxID=3131932 RepID=UPI003D049782